MVKHRRAGYGFTLIEMMITVLLIGVLALMAGPYTINWVHLSDIQRAKGQLVQTHGTAKAAAMRNPRGFGYPAPVAAIQLNPATRQLKVVECLEGESNCSGSQLWSEQLPAGISLMFDNDVSNIAVNLDNTGGALGDKHWLSYRISKGGQSEEGRLY